MITKKLDAEWLVREALLNEVFIYEFIEKNTNNKYIRNKGLIKELLKHLIEIKRANKLLEIGFQRKGLAFVSSYLFESFVKVHLHRVKIN